MATKKGFLSIPFLGSSTNRKHQDPTGQDGQHDGRRTNGNAAQWEINNQRSAAEIAKMREEEVITDYNSPIHMWVVSTLFPLIAGTFGPMASMFNVCAIATAWRIVVNPDSVCAMQSLQIPEATGRHISDPSWLVAVNIVSLAIAIIANLSLLGQMTSRLRYNISGPITIVGFFISGLVDVILVAVASQILPLGIDPDETYSQAFYYACFSGAIYVILALMLSVTAWSIWFAGYSTEFKLSLAQRSLMLQTILFLVYVLAAGAVYAKIENWTYLDANYFVIVTLFTIGFGDFTPTTHLGRSLFFPFAVGGIIFVGVIIANIRTVILESGSVKVSTRLVEKARARAIKSGTPEEGIFRVGGIKGVRKRDTNADTELQRRRKEFRLMREIQKEAAMNNRLVSLGFALIAFIVLWFIGGVAFWKAEKDSIGGQPWTYFDSLYFTFVAQLTIGYGDFEPQTNAGKPIFVFWALIALPTLTVLIGSVGDAVSAFVNWYTTWVGEHAEALYDIFVALYQPNNRARDKIKELWRNPDGYKDTEDQPPDDGFHQISDLDRQHTVPVDFPADSFTQLQLDTVQEKYRPYIVVRAAQEILKQLDSDPPKKYTYKEWSWVLKLLGEDEATENGHRKVGEPLPDGREIVTPVREGDHQVWSWLGQESPLMSLEEGSEPRWVLKRLMNLLEKELKTRAERHVERDIGPIPIEKKESSDAPECS